MAETATDHRRATAERNVAAILAAAEALLARGAGATMTDVAAEAGVSRVTVYAHFPTREALLEAVAERAVRRASAALAEAGLDAVSPAEALELLVGVSWAEIDRLRAAAEEASRHLSAAALDRAHDALRGPIADLAERGRREGAFRRDVPTPWLVSSYFALMHACAEDVRVGRLDAEDAVPVLRRTLRSVFAPPAGG